MPLQIVNKAKQGPEYAFLCAIISPSYKLTVWLFTPRGGKISLVPSPESNIIKTVKSKKIVNAPLNNLKRLVGLKELGFVGIGLIIGLTGYVAAAKPWTEPKSASDTSVTSTSSQGLADCGQYVSAKAPGDLVTERPECETPNPPDTNAATPGTSTGTSANSQTVSKPVTSSSNSNNSTATPSTSTVSKCNEALKASAQSYRDSSVAYENTVHNNWRYGGPQSSSYRYDAEQQENARHDAELAKIEQTYQQDLAKAGCT